MALWHRLYLGALAILACAALIMIVAAVRARRAGLLDRTGFALAVASIALLTGATVIITAARTPALVLGGVGLAVTVGVVNLAYAWPARTRDSRDGRRSVTGLLSLITTWAINSRKGHH